MMATSAARSGSGRILIAGNWHWDIYEEALAQGFQANGWEAVPFRTDDHVGTGIVTACLLRARCPAVLRRLNNALLAAVGETSPDAVFLNRSDLILPGTLKSIHEARTETVLLLHHNDHPYGGFLTRLKMRHYLRSIPEADATLVYRPGDAAYAGALGARRVELFPPYYLSRRHRPLPSGEVIDLVFVGHYEDDGRAEALDLLRRGGLEARVYGEGWEPAQRKYSWLAGQDIRRIWGDDYARVLSSARIALVFLSFRNRDVYTRRCFEIPACGAMMLAPRTRELESFFTDGQEAVYYDSPGEMLAKIRHYLDHEDERTRIARAGRIRCLRDGHDERARARFLIDLIGEIRREKARR